MKRKGQYSAPFELLVAVIILIFVIAIAFNVMADIKVRDCSSKTSKALSDLKVALERAVTENAPSDFQFNLPIGCAQRTTVTLKPFADTEICSATCGGAKRDCLLIQYTEFEFLGGASASTECPGPNCAQVSGRRECVEIPTTTAFISQQSVDSLGCNPGQPCPRAKCQDQSLQNLYLKSYYEDIEDGRYVLLNRTPVGASAFPVLCAYKEEII